MKFLVTAIHRDFSSFFFFFCFFSCQTILCNDTLGFFRNIFLWYVKICNSTVVFSRFRRISIVVYRFFYLWLVQPVLFFLICYHVYLYGCNCFSLFSFKNKISLQTNLAFCFLFLFLFFSFFFSLRISNIPCELKRKLWKYRFFSWYL